MLNFIAENTACYEWDAHVLHTMHGTNLARLVASMTDMLNKGNELSIYALCDMLKQHAFLFTQTKPWTTVDGSIANLAVPELCMMCDVRLIYLGENRYGEIRCKPEINSPIPRPILPKQEQPVDMPVSMDPLTTNSEEVVVGILDDSQTSCTLVSLPTSPQASEIEAAKTLLMMKDKDGSFSAEAETRNVETDIVEPIIRLDATGASMSPTTVVE